MKPGACVVRLSVPGTLVYETRGPVASINRSIRSGIDLIPHRRAHGTLPTARVLPEPPK